MRSIGDISFEVYNRRKYIGILKDIVAKLTPVDKAEAEAMCGGSALDGLEQSLSNSVVDECYILFINGVPEGAFGLVKSMTNRAANKIVSSPWLLASDELRKYPKSLTSTAKEILSHWATMGDLINFVSTENHRSIRWLRTLGFTIDKKQTYRFFGSLGFYRFYRLAKEVPKDVQRSNSSGS